MELIEWPPQQHDEIGLAFCREEIEDPRVAQDVIDGVRDVRRVVRVEAIAAENRVVDVDDVAQHREQVLLDAADHLTVDERARRRVSHFELHALRPGGPDESRNPCSGRRSRDVVGFESGRQHGQRAAPEQIVNAALPRGEQLLDFALREIFETAER